MPSAGHPRTVERFWIMLALATAAFAAMGTPPVRAQATAAGSLHVVELFTSQGCSSCPAADRLFKSYAERRDLVALSYSVDYWDYLGWKDTLATPKFTSRQRGYAKARGDGKVYTPQIVIDGSAHVIGSDQAGIDEAIRQTSVSPASARVPVRCWLDNGAVVVEVGPAGDGWPAAAPRPGGTIWLAVVQPKVQVPVKHGENRGQTLDYYNVVRELLPAGMYSEKGATIRLPRNALSSGAGERFAVVLQQGTTGPIVGAAWMGPTR